MFFEVEKILKAKQPYAFLLENVKQLVTIDQGATFKTMISNLQALGYHTHWQVLNALDYGIPQKRERVIIVGFKKNHPFSFPQKKEKRLKLEDILEPDDKVDKKHFISEHIASKLKTKVTRTYSYATIWHENKSGNIGVHDYSCAQRANASHNYLLVNGKRRLTPRENLRLMGFPDSFTIAVSDRAIRTQAGNSVVIPMIQAVAEEMMKALALQPSNEKSKTIKIVKRDNGYPRQIRSSADQLSILEEYAA
jgi:DNA (cytosine-5)-methyltransferase 1